MLQVQAKHIQNLLDQQKFNDITFIVGKNQTQYSANRLLLASISPVFDAMLYGEMYESKKDAEVHIEDVDESAFKAVLKYAYCGEPKITVENVLNIKYICRKYQIESLADFCDKFFRSCVNTNNFCTLLNAATKLKLEQYIKYCHQYYNNKRTSSDKNVYKKHSKGFSALGSDMHFIVGEKKVQFNAHTVLVASISPVFNEMINEKSLRIVIDDDNVDPVAFGSVLEYSYCSSPGFDAKNIVQIKYICKKYKIKSLLGFCDEYFNSILSADNFCLMLEHSIRFKYDGFLEKCDQFLDDYRYRRNAYRKSVIHNYNNDISEHFLKLSLKSMIWLLKSDDLNINEESLWKYVITWAEYQAENNPKYVITWAEYLEEKDEEEHFETSNYYKLYLLKSVRKCIRFGLMSGKFIAKKVKPLNVLNDHELATVLLYQFDKAQGCGDFCTERRR
eukprot:252513_1